MFIAVEIEKFNFFNKAVDPFIVISKMMSKIDR